MAGPLIRGCWRWAGCAWGDRLARPYDTPICDFALPRTQALRLREFGFTRVVASPFRRCLQTAAVVAATLGIHEVEVHLGLGEAMAQVKRNGWPDDPGHELTYLTHEEMAAALREALGKEGEGPGLGAVRGSKPDFGQDDVRRIRSVLTGLCAELASSVGAGGSALLVTHGDVVATWVEMATRETMLQCEYCGFVVYGLEPGALGAGATAAPADFAKCAEDGVMSMLGDW